MPPNKPRILLQPTLAIGQYARNDKGETVPTWEVEVAVTWDSGFLSMQWGKAENSFSGRQR